MYFLLFHGTPVKYAVPMCCPVLTFNSVTKSAHKKPRSICQGCRGALVPPQLELRPGVAAPEGMVKNQPTWLSVPAALPVVCCCEAWSAQIVLSDAGSPACFLPSHAFTHPGFLAPFLFYIIASDTVSVICLRITPTGPVM